MIPMQQKLVIPEKIKYLLGSENNILNLKPIPALTPFDEQVIAFLNDVSKNLMSNSSAKKYSDIITFAFWIRKGALMKLKERFYKEGCFTLGRGLVFHIAPSNVPVNFAYSLVVGLLCGNVNIVRLPSREFSQIDIILEAFRQVLSRYESLKSYVICVRYNREKEINDYFSSFADVRVIWGGDNTIAELRKSPLPSRSGEIAFADRFSVAFIDSDVYMNLEDKDKIANDFYNDTFFSDQNACTSPRMVIWSGNSIEMAKKIFWNKEYALVKKKYNFQDIYGVNKLATTYRVSATNVRVKMKKSPDNLIVRVNVNNVTDYLMDYKESCGYFYEYDCMDIEELWPLVNDKRCQTISYIGERDKFDPLLMRGAKGIDRIVPIGKTMDFDFIWDGYNLYALLTRICSKI